MSPTLRSAPTARRLAGAVLAAVLLTGCGGSGQHMPRLAGLPLVPGATVDVRYRTCDRGADAYCALQLVVVAGRYRTSQQLLNAEGRLLRRDRWTRDDAPNGLETSANSPGDRLRVTFATANGDLEGIDLGWIKRARPVTLALSHLIFSHASALSVELQLGPT